MTTDQLNKQERLKKPEASKGKSPVKSEPYNNVQFKDFPINLPDKNRLQVKFCPRRGENNLLT